jgi:hypothetical protein
MPKAQKAKAKIARKPKRKANSPHRPVSIAAGKNVMIKALAQGKAPADAAHVAGVSRATAYNWKRDDQEFESLWIEAVESSLDRLETVLYESALTGDPSNLQFALKHRRRNVYNNTETDRPQASFIMNITLQEQYKRLERLGLPLPMIESDYEEIVDDAGADTDRSRPGND